MDVNVKTGEPMGDSSREHKGDGTAVRSKPRRARPAHHFLLAFAAALVVPGFILASWLAWQYAVSERSGAIERARYSARDFLIAVDRELIAPEIALKTLATAPLLRSGDLASFHGRAKQTADALGTVITVRKPGEAKELLNTSMTFGAPLPDADAEILALEQASTEKSSSIVSGLLVSPARKTAVVGVIQPVLEGGKPIYILSATVPARLFATGLKQVLLPSGWQSELFDPKGLTIATTSQNGSATGISLPQDWLQHATGAEGLWHGRSLGNIDVTVAYARSQETGWIVAVTVPDQILNVPVWRAIWLLLILGAALVLLTVFLAYWSAARLSNAIRSLQLAGSRYAGDHSSSAIDTQVEEINEVGSALANAISRANRRQAQLESILATVPSAMVIIDRRGIIQAFSKSAEKMYGYTSEEICGSNVSRLMPEPDRGRHDGYISHYRETGEKRIIGIGRLVTGMRKDGTHFPVELHVGEANVEGETLFTGFMLDQTEKQRMEQELRQTQKMEAIGKLTGGVAHDFNNLLTVIKGNLEMLEDFIGDQERDLLRDSQEAADLAAQLTTSLLAFGRRMPLNPKRLDVGEMITATGDLLRRTLGETIEITTSIKKTSDVVIDGPQLQNAILNLAINARDAMPGGGKLTIGVSEVELDEDYAAAYGDVRPGRYVMIAMTDTGTGMSKEVRERAFEPFFTTKPQGSGTGLGLSSVYGFVKQSNGHVALYSEEGHGTTIRVYLPTTSGKARGERPSSGKEALPKGNNRVVLVVEDDSLVRRVTVARLKTLGYHVVEAASGPAALGLLNERNDIELLFTDMVMPGGMTGADLANEARRLRPMLKILFTSGYAEPELVREADSTNETWLKKPYTASDLAHRIHSILNS